jgi:CheY-like chemotaxis protein/HPt (histidine-containing phosphotransfer) domain-containing protein
MAPEVVNGLFAPFYQGDSSITRRFGGTGLGLSITRGLVELMGGSIDAQSALGVGSTFTVKLSLPLPVSVPQQADRPDLPDMASVAHARILVADDAITNQKVALQMLGKIGLTGVAASNGDEAVRLLSRTHFDLILMDCQMPVMDGFAATRMIRSGVAGEHNRQIPIVAMTANALTGDRERCLQAGMNDYLPKPVALDELRYKVLQWLSSAAQAHPPLDTLTSQLVAPAMDTEQVPFLDAPELLRNCGGDKELALVVVDTVLVEARDQIERLEPLISAEDAAGVAQQCHLLSGLFSQISARRLVEGWRSAEREAKQGRVPEAGWLPRQRQGYEALLRAIEGFRAEATNALNKRQ